MDWFDYLSNCCNFSFNSKFWAVRSLDIVLVGAVYLLGVQGITISIHLPLNNHIQKLNVGEMNDQTLNDERSKFEAKWNFFNYIRTVVAFSVSLIFIVILTLR